MEFLTTTQTHAMSSEGTDADRGAVMMRYLEDVAGEKLQTTLQQFLLKYYYKPASWNSFILLLNEQVPGENVSQFSDAWVKQKGLPTILTTYQDGYLVVTQTPPTGSSAFWRQQFDVRLVYDFEKSRTIEVDMAQPVTRIKLNSQPSSIIPNYSGRGYGHFIMDNSYTKNLPLRIMVTREDLNRYALLLTTFDNYKLGRIPASYFGELYRDMLKEKDPRIMQLAVDHMMEIALDRSVLSERQTLEQCIMDLLPENRRPECRQAIIRKMATSASAPQILNQLYDIWQAQSDPLFDEHDYTEMAYRLAIMRPLEWQEILSRQRQLLKSDLAREEFDYVSRVCNPDMKVKQDLANTLKKADSQHGVWAKHALQILNTK
jgi:aminopeptidase N